MFERGAAENAIPFPALLVLRATFLSHMQQGYATQRFSARINFNGSNTAAAD
jgi:hypothetical protein